MQRILVVEDNKSLAKLIYLKISEELEFEVDVAYKLSEAKLFLSKYDYFTTILDINLPDAPKGEVVDFVLSKKQSAIVLSSNIDREFRKTMLKKNIVDYVNKAGVHDIDYVIQIIKRLQKNQTHKVLVVDDSMVFRKQMSGFLENLMYKVVSVAHGEEALGILNSQPDISLVITDYNMPVMDGLELTQEIRKEFDKNQLCILALSANNDEDVSAMFLKNGANDFIKKPFSKEEFSCRVNNSIEALENIQIITNQAQRDFLTGLYNRRFFFQNMQNYISTTQEHFVVAMIDIDNFKNINDTYGHDVGDKVIIELADILTSGTSHHDLVSRFGGEEFCVVLKNTTVDGAYEVLERLRSSIESNVVQTDNQETIRFTVSIGAAKYDEDETLDEAINLADMKLYNAKNSGKNKVEI